MIELLLLLLLVDEGRELGGCAEDVVVVDEVVGVVRWREDTDAFVVGVVWVVGARYVDSVFLYTVRRRLARAGIMR